MADSQQLAFRPAAAPDVPAIVALVQSAYRGEEFGAGWTTEAHLLGGQRTDAAAVLEVIDKPDSWLLLAEESGELVGCCQLERTDAEHAYFGMFSVRPAIQGRGLGRVVIGEAERRATAWGARQMRLTVIRQRVDLIAWYERLGYALTGTTFPFPYHDQRFGVPKVDDLEFVELAKPLFP